MPQMKVLDNHELPLGSKRVVKVGETEVLLIHCARCLRRSVPFSQSGRGNHDGRGHGDADSRRSLSQETATADRFLSRFHVVAYSISRTEAGFRFCFRNERAAAKEAMRHKLRTEAGKLPARETLPA